MEFSISEVNKMLPNAVDTTHINMHIYIYTCRYTSKTFFKTGITPSSVRVPLCTAKCFSVQLCIPNPLVQCISRATPAYSQKAIQCSVSNWSFSIYSTHVAILFDPYYTLLFLLNVLSVKIRISVTLIKPPYNKDS